MTAGWMSLSCSGRFGTAQSQARRGMGTPRDGDMGGHAGGCEGTGAPGHPCSSYGCVTSKQSGRSPPRGVKLQLGKRWGLGVGELGEEHGGQPRPRMCPDTSSPQPQPQEPIVGSDPAGKSASGPQTRRCSLPQAHLHPMFALGELPRSHSRRSGAFCLRKPADILGSSLLPGRGNATATGA